MSPDLDKSCCSPFGNPVEFLADATFFSVSLCLPPNTTPPDALCAPQNTNYPALRTLYEKYKADGFNLIAFPCNQARRQDGGWWGCLEGDMIMAFPLTGHSWMHSRAGLMPHTAVCLQL